MSNAPTNLYTTLAPPVGIREDVSELIHNISPTETPSLSMIGTSTATQRSHQWQTDELLSPKQNSDDNYGGGPNMHYEGDDTPLEVQSPTSMNENVCSISKKTFGVSGTLEVTSTYGRDSELAYLAAKAARELKTDVDFAMTGLNVAKKNNETTTPRTTGSFRAYVITNVQFGAANTAGTGDGAGDETDAAARGAFTQTLLDDAIQSAWTNGGRPSIILAGPVQKTNLSGFDGVGTIAGSSNTIVRSDAASRTIYATADVYVSNFGTLNVVPSRHMYISSGTGGSGDSDVLLVDPAYAKIAYLRPWQQYDLSKTGDSIRREMLVEWTLEVCNEKAHGRISDLI